MWLLPFSDSFQAVKRAVLEAEVLEGMQAVQQYTWARIGVHEKAEQAKGIAAFEAARLLNFRFVKHHQLSNEEIDLLQGSFPFITAAEVISNLVAEKDDYYLAASIVDVGYDLWEFWSDNRSKLPLTGMV